MAYQPKIIYGPHRVEKSDTNAAVEELFFKGGPGSGIRGHRTAKKESSKRMGKIPGVGKVPSYDGDVQKWTDALADAGALYHLEDDPADIIGNNDTPLFTPTEVAKVRIIVDQIFKDHKNPMAAALRSLNRVQSK